jgi:hypothetical protein
MPNYPARRTYSQDLVPGSPGRHVQRSLNAITARSEVALARIEAGAEEAMAVTQARNALSAAAAQADAVLSSILSALPMYDVSDAEFRLQLKQATRASVIADTLRFDP